jgi:hypothetical protein
MARRTNVPGQASLGGLPRRKQRAKIAPALRSAVKAAPWILDTDAPAVKLAERWSQEIDAADTDPDSVRLVGWLGTNLVGLLRGLGLTPESRTALGLGQDDADGDRLAELRNAIGTLTGPGIDHPENLDA